MIMFSVICNLEKITFFFTQKKLSPLSPLSYVEARCLKLFVIFTIHSIRFHFCSLSQIEYLPKNNK